MSSDNRDIVRIDSYDDTRFSQSTVIVFLKRITKQEKYFKRYRNDRNS